MTVSVGSCGLILFDVLWLKKKALSGFLFNLRPVIIPSAKKLLAISLHRGWERMAKNLGVPGGGMTYSFVHLHFDWMLGSSLAIAGCRNFVDTFTFIITEFALFCLRSFVFGRYGNGKHLDGFRRLMVFGKIRRWSDTQNIRHFRAVDYLFEAIAGSVAYAATIFLYGLSLLGAGFRPLQPLLFPQGSAGWMSFIFVVMAAVSQLVQDILAKVVLKTRVGTVPNRIFGRFWTMRTLSFAIGASSAGYWFSSGLMMLSQYLNEDPDPCVAPFQDCT